MRQRQIPNIQYISKLLPQGSYEFTRKHDSDAGCAANPLRLRSFGCILHHAAILFAAFRRPPFHLAHGDSRGSRRQCTNGMAKLGPSSSKSLCSLQLVGVVVVTLVLKTSFAPRQLPVMCYPSISKNVAPNLRTHMDIRI